MKEFELHEIEWTDEKVSRFWDAFSKIPHLQYFAQQVGRKVIRNTRKHIDFNDRILDYGSGKGFLIEYLLEGGAKNVTGCDFSEDSVKYINKKFEDNPHYIKAVQIESIPSSLPAGNFGCVFFMETIEHLIDKYYEPTLSEISRVVRKGGHVIVTTRNEENLDDLKVICPDCGGMFHRVQHVRSFSKTSLSEAMTKFGFREVMCESSNLGRPQLINLGIRFYKKLTNGTHKNPNLIYVGEKI